MSKNNNLEKQLDQLRRNRRLLWLAILSFAIVICWIVVSLLASQRELRIDAESKAMATPLIPRLETRVFEELAAKRVFSEEELADFPIYVFHIERGADTSIIQLGSSSQVSEPPPEEVPETEDAATAEINNVSIPAGSEVIIEEGAPAPTTPAVTPPPAAGGNI